MKKYKIRILAYGAELNAIIPFEQEPTIDQLHSKIIEYLNHNLFKIEYNVFVKAEHWTSTKKKRVCLCLKTYRQEWIAHSAITRIH